MISQARELAYDDIKIGDIASFSVAIDEALVDEFAKLSGDSNPLHRNVKYAAETQFGGRVAHGMLSAVFFSRLIGMYLPGKYSLYLSQSLRFHNPVLMGTEIIISGEVLHKTDVHKTVVMRMKAESKGKKIFATGDAMVQLLR